MTGKAIIMPGECYRIIFLAAMKMAFFIEKLSI